MQLPLFDHREKRNFWISKSYWNEVYFIVDQYGFGLKPSWTNKKRAQQQLNRVLKLNKFL